MTERLLFHFSLSCIGEGNGNLLQCSCLENPRDGGAWWSVIYGVAQSQTRLKRLSSSSSSRESNEENGLSDSQGHHLPFNITDKHRLLTLFVHKVLVNANGLHIFPPPNCKLHKCRSHACLLYP